MSYDIYLREPDSNAVIEFDELHFAAGGNYAMGGTTEAWLNVTYNYAPHFYKTMGEEGIRSIYGVSGKDSIPILSGAIAELGDDTDPNYWKATEGNAKCALQQLLQMAEKRPDGVWSGD